MQQFRHRRPSFVEPPFGGSQRVDSGTTNRVPTPTTDFFNAGGFSNLAPYTPEAYGVRMGARASGLGQGANGAGKIIGPLSLAVIAGTSNVLKPAATEAAVFPAFMFLAYCGLAIGLAFTFLGGETHGGAAGRRGWRRGGGAGHDNTWYLTRAVTGMTHLRPSAA